MALDNRPPARMDRGHALDGAPGARGPSELPTLGSPPHRDSRRSEKHLPAREKTGRALSSLPLPSPRKNFHVIVTQGEKDLLLQLVHGDLVDLRVELALADLLPRDAPVVLGHRRARLRGHLRSESGDELLVVRDDH